MFRNRKPLIIMLLLILATPFSVSLVNSMQAAIEKTVGYANLTGGIDDEGLDSDGNGKFDYLKIGVEVNVSIAGEYIVKVQGLLTDTYLYIDVSDTKREYLTPGIHTVHVCLYGPTIYKSSLNPVNVSSVSLQSVDFKQLMPQINTLDYISEVPMSRQYQFTEFDAPFRDMETIFTVYPNGSVALSGALNYTHMIPFNPGPKVHGTTDITRSGDLTTTSVNCTFVVPKEAASRSPVELPVNTTEVTYQEQYSDTQYSSDLSVNMTLPPWLASQYPFNATDLSLSGTYSEEIASMYMNLTTVVPEIIRSMFPFNVTDVTITGRYMDKQLTGNITFNVISGFPLFDFQMDFEGNKTDLSLGGKGLVIYGYYPTIGFEIDQEALEDMLAQYNNTLPGTGPNSLYSMTNGILECTHLDMSLTPHNGNGMGAWVDFDVGIHGDFIELMAYMMEQSSPPSYRDQVHDMAYAALNTTLNSVDSVDFQIVYMHDSGEAEISMTFVDELLYLVSGLAEIAEDAMALDNGMAAALSPIITIISLNATLQSVDEAEVRLAYSSSTGQLEVRATSSGEMAPEEFYQSVYPTSLLPEEMPPEIGTLFESMMELFTLLQETRFCNLTFYEMSFTYGDSVGNLRMESTLDGDFRAQTNFVKAFMATSMNLTSSKEFFLNQTLMDTAGFHMNFDVGGMMATGRMTGIMLSLPVDRVNATCFKLQRFFNLTSGGYRGMSEPPTGGQCLKITVRGGSNSTHTVTLHRPGTVPSPDETSTDMNLMSWRNQSVSGLKGLLFSIIRVGYQTTFTWDEVPYKVTTRTNSTVIESTFDRSSKKISFTVEGLGGTAGFCNVSIPKKLLNAPPDEWTVRVDGEEVTPTVTQTATQTFLYFTYSHSEREVEIVGTQVVPEFPSSLILPILMISTLVAVALTRKIQHKQKTTQK